MAVVFDPAAETVVRLSRYGSDLKDSHNVYVSVDGTDGRITQLHWLAGLPSRAYGHELKHFAGVPHHASPGDLLRGARRDGDDHLNEPGFTDWELEQIRETAASYVAPTVAPRPVGSPESDSASSGSDVGSSEPGSGSLPGRPAAMEWHPPTDADAGGQPSDSAEYYDPYYLGPEFADLGLTADPFAGFDMATPVLDPEGSSSALDYEVQLTTLRLASSAHRVEEQFDEWVSDVFDIFDAEDVPAFRAFYQSLLNTPEVSAKGITTVARLRVWAVRRLAEELAQGEQSTLNEFLPYPDGVSEQQRDALHRIWLDKLSNALSRDYELAHVIPHLMAKALSMSMRIHHPFDAPQDIGPTPDVGAVRHQVVFWNGAYHRVLPFDPNDSRLDDGFQQTAVSANEKEQLDALLAELKRQIDTAEANPTNRHGHILKFTFSRNLAAIGKQPVSPRRQARELVEYLRYLNSLRQDSGWQDESPQLESPFTLRLTAADRRGDSNHTTLNASVGGKVVSLLLTTQHVAPGDIVSIDFGKVGEEGVGIARIPHTEADGAERFIYRELDRKFDDNELAELGNRASALRNRVSGLRDGESGPSNRASGPSNRASDRVLESVKPSFVDSFRMRTSLRNGVLGVRFGEGDVNKADQRALISRTTFADGTPFVVPDDMKDVILEVGYDIDHRPLAVVEIPAERNGGQVALYLRLTDPAPTVGDIERLRKKESFWEPSDRWTLFDAISFDDVLAKRARLPNAIIDLPVSGAGATVDGLEVDLSAGAAITLRVGKRLVGPDIVSNVFVVVKAPLKPLDDAAKEAYLRANSVVDVSEIPTHAYRLVNTGKTNADFDTLIARLRTRQAVLGLRRERGEPLYKPYAKRRRTGGSSLPGGPAAFEWAGAASADGGVGSSSGWAAGVEPSVVWVDGGWRVSYRSAEG
ncbi:hypothetical protein, partial [Micromonospora sp. MH33]|uniref:hypothetical protein n=1 Tax=Micromonospora sp. MH33 TaxID=1945509 RepID=UPI0011B1D294